MKAIIFDFNRTLYNPDTERLFSGCLKVLKVLHQKYQLALITTQLGNRIELIDKLGLRNFFNKVIVTKKKSKADFITCCKALKVNPRNTIVVGDRVKGEITVGNQLNMITIQVKGGKFANELPQSKIETPRFVIKNLKELLIYG